ncbi:MAG: 50S ribosomal protein L24 [Bacteroidetes bacterium HGW-Bacteroidetes-21]|jgi:large subunit ribosomal protein L24|nr:MAG: 50S ribosomal protein L24 [Bacteroidetes bacterium HGW-Bacteroidetes-21]
MSRKFHIKKGDTVMVIAGDDRGKQGRVLEVIAAKEKAIVEGINLVSKHTKPNAASPQGGIVKKEAGINVSNLKLVEPSTGKPTRVGRTKNEKGLNVRVSVKTKEEIK